MLRARFIFAALLFGLSPVVLAQDDISHRSGPYEVFYSVLNTTFLSPEVASATKVVRAKNRALLNISVIEHLEGDDSTTSSTQPVALEQLEVERFDLVHNHQLSFSEIVETNARYYIATFKITNDNEAMWFRVNLKPEGSDKNIAFEFKRSLYKD